MATSGDRTGEGSELLVENRAAISDVLARYCDRLDAYDIDAVALLFCHGHAHRLQGPAGASM